MKFFSQIHHILGLFLNFENGRKIVKNHGLTPLLFGQIFWTRKLNQNMA